MKNKKMNDNSNYIDIPKNYYNLKASNLHMLDIYLRKF